MMQLITFTPLASVQFVGVQYSDSTSLNIEIRLCSKSEKMSTHQGGKLPAYFNALIVNETTIRPRYGDQDGEHLAVDQFCVRLGGKLKIDCRFPFL